MIQPRRLVAAVATSDGLVEQCLGDARREKLFLMV